MLVESTFRYNGNDYNFVYDDADASGLGCIREIVHNNEYLLNNFSGMENKHFIDIGANCGVASIILAKQNPQSIVLSYEPDEKVFELLTMNKDANSLTNLIIHNMAVGNNSMEELKLYYHPRYSGGNSTMADESTYSSYFNKDIKVITIPCTSLDKIVEEYNISEIELLKIDCEGAEYDIIYDSQFVTTMKIKNIVGEFHNLRYNTADNDYNKLSAYCKKYIKGIHKITYLTL